MDVVGLKDAAQVGPVRLALAQALEGGFLVPEGLEEGERKLLRIERLLRERRYGLLDLDGVHTSSRLSVARRTVARKGSTLILLARRITSVSS
jgi:hypothetical protein